MTASELKAQVLALAQRAYREQLMAGTSGNLSALSCDGKIVITPSAVDYTVMTERDIMVIDLNGAVLEGPHMPSSEWRMHAQIYRHKPEVRAVVHTHSPYATSFAVINKPIPLVLIEMIHFLGGDLRVAPVAVQGSDEVGLNCIPALEGRFACLMGNHGVAAVGKNLDEAYIRAVYAEDAAKITHMALAIGRPVPIPEEIVSIMKGR